MSAAAAPEGRKAANAMRLRSCSAPHEFKPVPPGPGETAVRRFMCTRCRGVADASGVWWWTHGHAAGRAEATAEFRAGAAGGWGAP